MAPAKRFSLGLTLLVLAASFPSDVRGAWEDDIMARIESLEMASNSLIRQTILQQFAAEEARRTDGDSGVKQVRNNADGTKAYYIATHSTHAAASIHNHADNIRTCGMGEIEVVLNGMHFRTRHNDYKLVQPVNSTGDYHKTEPVPLAGVPPAVLNAGSVVNQIREMRAWFRAWNEQNYTVRDYRPYFKPLLCYLEGAWTNNEKIDEPFESTRHHLDAASWFDLQEKIRFTSYTGDKDQSENFAFLPTAIFNISDGVPVLGQWNYRILCHQIRDNMLDKQHLKLVDDLPTRLRLRQTIKDFDKRRAARYAINEFDSDRSYGGTSLLDKIMAQIPGKDNYDGYIEDSALGYTKYDVRQPTEKLNAAYYHRWYRTGQIVWQTPLGSWNPYDIEYKGRASNTLGKTVTADDRDGGATADKALNGTNEINYMLTPVAFFSGGEVDPNPADTVKEGVGVLDKDGAVRIVSSSGIRIMLPEIVDVPGGTIRTRYPVFPVHAEGGTAFKEVDALKKIVMDLEENKNYLHTVPNFGTATQAPSTDNPWYTLVTSSSDAKVGVHTHHVELQNEQALGMINDGDFVEIRTSLANSHSLLLNITYNQKTKQFYYICCDGKADNVLCFDNHSQPLYREE